MNYEDDDFAEQDEFEPDEDGLLDRGEGSLKDLDDANVPVDIWLEAVEESDELYTAGYRYRLRCGAYLPRKGSVWEGAVEAYAKDRETMQKAIVKYIVPLYQIALHKINQMAEKGEGNLYYWSKDEDTDSNANGE